MTAAAGHGPKTCKLETAVEVDLSMNTTATAIAQEQVILRRWLLSIRSDQHYAFEYHIFMSIHSLHYQREKLVK
jgi:hypothetical protein